MRRDNFEKPCYGKEGSSAIRGRVLLPTPNRDVRVNEHQTVGTRSNGAVWRTEITCFAGEALSQCDLCVT